MQPTIGHLNASRVRHQPRSLMLDWPISHIKINNHFTVKRFYFSLCHLPNLFSTHNNKFTTFKRKKKRFKTLTSSLTREWYLVTFGSPQMVMVVSTFSKRKMDNYKGNAHWDFELKSVEGIEKKKEKRII